MTPKTPPRRTVSTRAYTAEGKQSSSPLFKAARELVVLEEEDTSVPVLRNMDLEDYVEVGGLEECMDVEEMVYDGVVEASNLSSLSKSPGKKAGKKAGKSSSKFSIKSKVEKGVQSDKLLPKSPGKKCFGKKFPAKVSPILSSFIASAKKTPSKLMSSFDV